MKKIVVRLAIAGVALVIIGFVVVTLFLDSAVKRGVELVGPKITKVSVNLDRVSLSLFSGSGTVKGLVVANPEGFKTPSAISVGTATLALKPTSVLSDKVVIHKIELVAPEITFEGGFGGNNLSKLLANINETTGGGTNAAAETESEGASKKLQVDDFLIRGAKLNVSITGMGGKMIPVTLPEIHLSNLGQGPDGITAAELTKVVLSSVEKYAIEAADKAVSEFGKNASELTKDLGKTAQEKAGEVGKNLGDLLKRK